MKSLAKKFKNRIITGIIAILPLGLTVWIVWILFRLIGEVFLPLFEQFPPLSELPTSAQMTISVILTIIVIWLIGVFARNFIGKSIIKLIEQLIIRTPVVSKIYKTIRQVTDTMFVNKRAFKKVALIEYPRRGILTMVFVTNDMETRQGDDLITVFVPSTPNPTTGYCVILPKEDVQEIPITINQAMEFIFSGGILVPDNFTFPKIESNRERTGG